MVRRTFLLLLFAVLAFCLAGCAHAKTVPVLNIAVPYSDYIQDYSDNYYVGWLEEKTGYKLNFTVIRQTDSDSYLSALFASSSDIDIVMFGGQFLTEEAEIMPYVESGDIYEKDGRFCYYNYGYRVREGVGQVLWINRGWLEHLGLLVPETTDELKAVLKAFKESDPNGNGLADELALVGSKDDYCYDPAEFILNAYVYNAPYDHRPNLLAYANAYREGVAFLNGLYVDDLLDKSIWNADISEMSELINSPCDMVGAFTTGSIADVIYQNNPEVLARYMHVLPLAGPHGERNAMYVKSVPQVGSIITGRSTHKAEAEKLLETMNTKEASLIARFGEEGVDWDYSDGSDVSIYGTASTIVTRNYIWNTFQNKHLNGIGPMNVPVKYLQGITWNGINSDMEYIDGRARMGYSAFLPDIEKAGNPGCAAKGQYADGYIEDFITGKKDIESDEEWERFLKGLE